VTTWGKEGTSSAAEADNSGHVFQDARARVSETVEEIERRAAEAAAEAKHRAAEASAKVSRAVSDKVEEIEHRVAGAVEEAKVRAAEARVKVEQAVSEKVGEFENRVAGVVEEAKHRAAEVRAKVEQVVHYTLGEEIANSVTHGLGALLSVAGLTLLATLAALRGEAIHVAAVSIYGATLVLTYIASTLYHSLPAPKAKRIFRVFDHICIYLLIAGSYTPFLLLTLGGGFGWTLLCVVWTLALAGSIFKIFSTGRHHAFSTFSYLGLGWLAVLLIKPLLSAIPLEGFLLVCASGAFYTAGVAFYVWEKLPYNHAIWHGFVMAGSACHFFAVLLYVIPAGA
jgi:hemolysin III